MHACMHTVIRLCTYHLWLTFSHSIYWLFPSSIFTGAKVIYQYACKGENLEEEAIYDYTNSAV